MLSPAFFISIGPQTIRKVLTRLKYSAPLYKAGIRFRILTEECLTFRTVSHVIYQFSKQHWSEATHQAHRRLTVISLTSALHCSCPRKRYLFPATVISPAFCLALQHKKRQKIIWQMTPSCFDPLGRRQFKVHPANLLDINIIQNSHSVVYLSRPPFRPTSWHPTISVKA